MHLESKVNRFDPKSITRYKVRNSKVKTETAWLHALVTTVVRLVIASVCKRFANATILVTKGATLHEKDNRLVESCQLGGFSSRIRSPFSR